MYIKKVCGYLCTDDFSERRVKGRLDTYNPPLLASENYKNWIAELDLRVCENAKLCTERFIQ